MPTYTLEERQEEFYTEVVDLYKPVKAKTSAQTYTLEYQDVPCMFIPTPNFDEKTGGFRSKQNSIMTSDGIHFHSEQECGDEWVVHIKTGLRGAGSYKKCIGATRDLARRAKVNAYYVIDQLPLTAGQIV